jgi:hypothetical protein
MNGMVWRDIPLVAKPAELAAVQQPSSYPDYKRYRERSDGFASMMAYVAPTPFSVSVGGRVERVWGHLVTPSYFTTLGVQRWRGSLFDPSYDQPGEAPAVVVSYRFWQTRLGSDELVVGKTLRINGQTVTVVGVAPAGFLGASPVLYPADLWMPVSAAARIAPELAGNMLERRDRQIFRVTGRLKPAVTMAGAEAALETVARQIEEDNGDPDRTRGGRRITLLDGGRLLQFRKQEKPLFTSFSC